MTMAITLARRASCAIAALMAIGALSTAGHAATIKANASTFAAVMGQAVGGDIIVLSGEFPETSLRNLNYITPLLLDARLARFPDGISIRDSVGITIKGGTFGLATQVSRLGRSIDINGGGTIRIDGGTFIGAAGVGTGVLARNASKITITRATFTGLRLGAGLQSVTSSSLTNNIVTRSSSDGFAVAGSSNVNVSGNICRDGAPSAGAHPDCVQLWSLVGQPMQSGIRILNNKAYGPTQGFTSFDPATASGRSLRFEGNYLETSFPQGIACYGCFNSIFNNNTLVTLPDAQFRTSMNVVGGSGNSINGTLLVDNRAIALDGDLPPALADNLLASIDFLWPDAASAAGNVLVIDGIGAGAGAGDGVDPGLSTDLSGATALPGDALMASMAMRGLPASISGFSAAVPEPASWALWISGFGLLGLALRRRVPAHG